MVKHRHVVIAVADGRLRHASKNPDPTTLWHLQLNSLGPSHLRHSTTTNPNRVCLPGPSQLTIDPFFLQYPATSASMRLAVYSAVGAPSPARQPVPKLREALLPAPAIRG